MLPRLTGLAGKAYDFLFPRRCVGCGREGEYICSACQASLLPIKPPFCSRCGLPLSGGTLCSGCTVWEAEINGIRAAFRFDGVARQVIYQLKYQNLKAIAPEMARLMLATIPVTAIPGDILVAVPLHLHRMRKRGYNQSALLARELARLTGLEFDEACLKRNYNTPSQARTRNVLERRENVRGAFSCQSGNLRGRRVILVDDVATSGATLNAGAAALKQAGALSVWGLTFAREI
jgi:ComF family protein